MKKQRSFSHAIIGVALVTVLILIIPLVAMQFTDEVKWSSFDFLVMGTLIFGIGVAFKLITRSSTNVAYQIASGIAFGTAFLMVWANLAVGLIGSGPNPGNLIYMVVPVMAITGAFLANFNPARMERAMYATSIALGVITVIALLTNMDEYPGSSTTEILAVSGLFLVLFPVAALIFRYAARQSHSVPEKSSIE